MRSKLQIMKRIQTLSKRIVFGVLSAGFVLSSLLSLLPQKTLAAGETYKWKDFQTITVTGGDLGGSSFRMTADASNNQFSSTVTYKNQCIFDALLNTNGGNSGTYAIDLGQQVVTAPGQPGLCSQTIMKSFNGKSVSIGGTRPSDSSTQETDAQKQLDIVVQSAKPAAESPGSVTITVKDASGKVVNGPTQISQETPPWENDSTPSSSRAVQYEETVSLDPGDYQICVDNLLNKCYTYTKVKYKSDTVTLGDSIGDQTIDVTIKLTYTDPANATRVLGPTDVTLQKADGSGPITTIQTDSNTHTPTNDQLNSTQYATIEASLYGTFTGIDQGTFKICVPDIDACKTVTKDAGKSASVLFETDKAAQLTQGFTKGDDNICPKQLKSWGLQYVACPLFSAANKAIQGLEDFVTSLLATDTDNMFGTINADGTVQQSDAAKAYYGAWNTFRVLAVAIIIIIGLIMVLSEALGLDVFDAYTIRKVLPRLLIALIFISISWWVMKEVIIIFNNLTVWIGSVIAFPFSEFKDQTASAWSIVGQWTFIFAAVAIVGPLGILSFAGTIFFALIIAAMVLIARRIILTLLVIAAPLFIACYIVPNTQKMARFWRDTFIGVLLMGPIFTSLIEVGHIASKIAAKADKFGVIAFMGLVLPIAAMPVVFAKLGGGVAMLIGFANNRSKGGFDRLKNYRAEQRQERAERAKSGNLFGAGLIRGEAAAKLNKFTAKSALGARGNFGLGTKGQAAYQQRMQMLAVNHLKSEHGEAAQWNDDLLRGQTYRSEAEMRQNMVQDWGMYKEQDNGDYIQNSDGQYEYVGEGNGNFAADTETLDRVAKSIKANGGWGDARAYSAAQQLAATGTGYDNVEQVTKTIARVARGNAQAAGALAGNINNTTKRAKRHDLAIGVGGYVGGNGLVTKQMAAEANGGAGAPTAEDYRKASITAFENVDFSQLAKNDYRSVENISKDLYSGISAAHARAQAAATPADREKHEREAARLTALLTRAQDSMGRYGSLQNTQIMHDNTAGQDAAGIIKEIRRDSTPEVKREVTFTPQRDTSGNVTGFVQNERVAQTPAPKQHMQEESEIYLQPRPPANNNRDRYGPAA